MALQGELQSFAITDVLRLLSATGKSGRLEVDGDRGRVVAWFRGGGIAGGQVSTAPHAHEPVDIVFELLRFGHGWFCFEDDVPVVESHPPLPVDDLLTRADAMLTEWQALRAAVPTIDVRLRLAPEIASAEVVVSRDRWRALAQVACAASVREVGDRLAITDLAAWRMVRDLVTDGLLVLSPDDLHPMAEVATLGAYRGTASARACHPSHRPAAESTFTSADRDRPLRDSDGRNGATHLRTVDDEPLSVTAGPAVPQLGRAVPEAIAAGLGALAAPEPVPASSADGDHEDGDDREANRSSLLRFLSTVRG